MSNLKDSGKPFGPVEKDDWTVSVDKEKCIGAGICTAIAAQSFELDAEGKALILNGIDQENKEALLDSAKACPVAAIIIKNKDGSTVYPE
ncbi:MAG: ferredoxin [Candidatus Moraniibacteriota bacterium]|nr:MAG: ferredoxin [Candidatus Moranbacteria bacterium]